MTCEIFSKWNLQKAPFRRALKWPALNSNASKYLLASQNDKSKEIKENSTVKISAICRKCHVCVECWFKRLTSKMRSMKTLSIKVGMGWSYHELEGGIFEKKKKKRGRGDWGRMDASKIALFFNIFFSLKLWFKKGLFDSTNQCENIFDPVKLWHLIVWFQVPPV